MMKARACGRGLLPALVVLGWCVSVHAQQNEESFRKGIDARNNRRWQDVVTLMEEAIRADGTESSRRVGSRLGFGGSEYLPHFHLGAALFNLGDCSGALTAWDESTRQGIVLKQANAAAELQKGVAACEDRGFLSGARLASETQRVTATIDGAAAAAQDVETLRKTNAASLTADLRAMADGASRDLAGARERLASARRSRRAEEMADADATADRARQAFVTARDTLARTAAATARIQTRAAEVEGVLDGAARAAQTIDGLIAASPSRRQLPAPLLEEQRQARALLDTARTRLTAAQTRVSDEDMDVARVLATDSRTAYTRLQTNVEQWLASATKAAMGDLRASTGRALEGVDTRLAEVRAVAVARPRAGEGAGTIDAELNAAGEALARVRRQFDQAVGAGNLERARSVANEVSRLQTRVEAIGALLGETAPPSAIPDALRQAAQSFFEARYQDTLDALAGEVSASFAPSHRVHAHVLRAAALFALYEYSDRREDALGAAARQEVEAGRSLDPAFQPNPLAFSPRFLSFFAGEPATPSR